MTVTPDEQLRWILDRVPLMPERECELRSSDALGATVARDASARCDLPLWDNSAMDGYALRGADIEGASAAAPVRLFVVGEVAAGSAEDPRIEPGTAVRIMTGAPVPSDADTVVPVEQTLGDGFGDGGGEGRGGGGAPGTRGIGGPWADSAVSILAAPPVGANIRRRGEDTAVGSVLATSGQELTAVRLAALAAAGVNRVTVRRVPRVAVLTTGSELRAGAELGGAPGGEILPRGQIPESNSLLVSGLLRESGLVDVEVVRCPDDLDALREQLDALSRRCDVIVTTGGVGPGRHDIVRIALEDEPEVRHVRVAMRPGQLQCAGRLAEGAFVFALPGNPVSAAVNFEMFVRPAILAMQGRARVHRPRVLAAAERSWRGAVGRLQVLPVRLLDGAGDTTILRCAPVVNPRGVSHAVGGHGAVEGYALVEAERGDVEAGEAVTVMLVAR